MGTQIQTSQSGIQHQFQQHQQLQQQPGQQQQVQDHHCCSLHPQHCRQIQKAMQRKEHSGTVQRY